MLSGLVIINIVQYNCVEGIFNNPKWLIFVEKLLGTNNLNSDRNMNNQIKNKNLGMSLSKEWNTVIFALCYLLQDNLLQEKFNIKR